MSAQSEQSPKEMRVLFKELEIDRKRKSLAKKSTKELIDLRDRLFNSISDVASYLNIQCAENDISCIESKINEIRQSIVKDVDLRAVDKVLEDIDIIMEMDKRDWQIIKQLIYYSISNEPAITRHIARGSRHLAIRDHISDTLGSKLGIYGSAVEYGFVERTPLILVKHKWCRLNFLSDKLFSIAEDILRFRSTYNAFKILQMISLVKDMIEQYKIVSDILERRQKTNENV